MCSWYSVYSKQDGRDDFKDKGIFGRPSTSVNEGSVARNAAILKEAHSVTIEYFAAEHSISVGSTHILLQDELRLRKRCSRFILHDHTSHQKKQRVSICHDLFSQFKPIGPKRLSDVVTGNEWWIPILWYLTSRETWFGWLTMIQDRKFWRLDFDAGRECSQFFQHNGTSWLNNWVMIELVNMTQFCGPNW